MIAHLRSLLKEATPGPWSGDGEGIWADWTTDRGLETSKMLFGHEEAEEHDAALIAASRNHLEALLDCAEALRTIELWPFDAMKRPDEDLREIRDYAATVFARLDIEPVDGAA